LKKYIIVLVLVCALSLMSCESYAETKIIESKAILIINGKIISTPFKVVVSENGITVNDVEFPLGNRIHIEVDPKPAATKPSIKDEAYIDWFIKTAIQKNNYMLAEGRTKEEIWGCINSFLKENSDSLYFIVNGDKGHYRIEKRNSKVPILFSLPTELKVRSIPTKEEKINKRYHDLCKYLEKGYYIVNNGGRLRIRTVNK